MTETRENIMDYVQQINQKAFITYQWERMRNVLLGKSEGIQLDIIDSDNFQALQGEIYSDTSFTNILFKAMNQFHNEYGLVMGIDDQKKILNAIIDSIKEQINKLCII